MLRPTKPEFFGLEGRIARHEGATHRPPLRGRDQFGHCLAVVEVRNVPDVGSDEPIGQAIHLEHQNMENHSGGLMVEF